MVWIVGQHKGVAKDGHMVWEFQGVFSTEEKAAAASRTPDYFVAGPYEVDQELPHERRDVEVRWPVTEAIDRANIVSVPSVASVVKNDISRHGPIA